MTALTDEQIQMFKNSSRLKRCTGVAEPHKCPDVRNKPLDEWCASCIANALLAKLDSRNCEGGVEQ